MYRSRLRIQINPFVVVKSMQIVQINLIKVNSIFVDYVKL